MRHRKVWRGAAISTALDAGLSIDGSPSAETASNGALSWQPPSLTNGGGIGWDPVVYHMTNAKSNGIRQSEVGGGKQDILLICDEVLYDREIYFYGWRHIEWIGGEVNIRQARDATYRQGITLQANTGIIHLEGLHVWGSNNGMTDASRSNSGGNPASILQIQHCRFGPCVNTTAGQHSDGYQPQNNTVLAAARFDYNTFIGDEELVGGLGDSHGLLMKNESGSAIARWDIRRMNFRGFFQALFYDDTYSSPCALGQTTTSTDVKISTAQRASFGLSVFPGSDNSPRQFVVSGDTTYGNWINMPDGVTGRVGNDMAAPTDYVSADSVGMDYVSPGYL